MLIAVESVIKVVNSLKSMRTFMKASSYGGKEVSSSFYEALTIKEILCFDL